jgi:hypothetical protein
MATIDDAQIQSLVSQLDQAVPREGHVEVFTHEPTVPVIRANQQGYLRLGVEFLKAAYAPVAHQGGRAVVEIDLDYLEGLQDHGYSFERREDVWSPVSEEEESGAWSVILKGVGMALVLAVMAALLVGAFTILGWLGRLLG